MKRVVATALIFLTSLAVSAVPDTQPATDSMRLTKAQAEENSAKLAGYEKKPAMAGKISCNGIAAGMMLVHPWSEEFATIYPDVKFEVHGGGASSGLTALMHGTTDLACLNRTLTDEENKSFKDKFGYEATCIAVAQDAIGIYVNKDNPIPSLTIADVRAIYATPDKDGPKPPAVWGDLGVTGPLAGQVIERYCLGSANSAHTMFRNTVLRGAEYRIDVKFDRIPSSLIQGVGTDEAGVTFGSVMLETTRTRFVPLVGSDGKAYLPSCENATNGKYPLAAPMIMVFNRAPGKALRPELQEFLRFAISRRGQYLAALEGVYPLRPEQQGKSAKALD